MTVLTKLKLTNAKREVIYDPVLARRQKLMDKLGEQVKLAAALIAGETARFTYIVTVKDSDTGERKQVEKEKRVRSWFWHDLDGKWFLEIRFGNKVVDLGKNRAAIEVGDKENLVATIETVIGAVKDGELDEPVTAIAGKRNKQTRA
jgi:hypothetical protein